RDHGGAHRRPGRDPGPRLVAGHRPRGILTSQDAGPDDFRIISSAPVRTERAGPSYPSSRSTSMRTAAETIASGSGLTEVSGGLANSLSSVLSKPVTATSSGTRRPWERSARTTPIAVASFA